ncbi:hypothetical protein HanXRQr2_Chr02g0070031 [Helianthus annuus]|uniref:Uncharacterized protein n=1 Tax=Helianthus annuus TaxID=4232 RepID=A0A9K3NZX1_HELAN|nr:hypothetical protein HanXRQr2_Chr02g0070031 [Helianthus annuus]KAJ0605019.1 hypothetical protein HanHA300_Chr02g0058281 [Helianthus annuus]KAJ0619032.1 hypothetical protein HanHA89_Chr02g0066761 [Helianthus annuus]KAJ0777485.1 hypothetical protein HanLR1_Chr02g0061021 [Helianthus annuus]KAJ0952087.1 hypothetical protein HanPSC8_Chr02g0068041 [Helianthus annuus]
MMFRSVLVKVRLAGISSGFISGAALVSGFIPGQSCGSGLGSGQIHSRLLAGSRMDSCSDSGRRWFKLQIPVWFEFGSKNRVMFGAESFSSDSVQNTRNKSAGFSHRFDLVRRAFGSVNGFE